MSTLCIPVFKHGIDPVDPQLLVSERPHFDAFERPELRVATLQLFFLEMISIGHVDTSANTTLSVWDIWCSPLRLSVVSNVKEIPAVSFLTLWQHKSGMLWLWAHYDHG